VTTPDVPQGLFRPLGRLRWPWRIVTTTPRGLPPLVSLIRRPRQVIGVYLRLPDGADGRHYGLTVLWGRPDVRAYPRDIALPVRQAGQGWQ
jgi:hypothetical protein